MTPWPKLWFPPIWIFFTNEVMFPLLSCGLVIRWELRGKISSWAEPCGCWSSDLIPAFVSCVSQKNYSLENGGFSTAPQRHHTAYFAFLPDRAPNEASRLLMAHRAYSSDYNEHFIRRCFTLKNALTWRLQMSTINIKSIKILWRGF